jgi:hypothetical protein
MPTLRRALAMAGLGLALAGGVALADGLGPTIEKARGGSCVDDPEVMRRIHPDLLKHQRNETVHRGIRDQRASLKGCIECHASPTSGSVAVAKTDFCVSCHSYAAVQIDCFECHASRPKQAALHSPADSPASADGTRLLARWSGRAAEAMIQR